MAHRDKGKKVIAYPESVEVQRENKRRYHPSNEGPLRDQQGRQPTSYDPPYHGRPPRSLVFSESEDSDALLPQNEPQNEPLVKTNQMNKKVDFSQEIYGVSGSPSNTISKTVIAQLAITQREKRLSSPETISPSSLSISPHAPGLTSTVPASPSPTPVLNSINQFSQVSGSAPSTLSKATLAQRARRQREKGLSSPETLPPSNISFGPHAPGLNSPLPASPAPSTLLHSINQISEVSRSAPITVSKAALAQRARRQREKGLSSLETILPSSVPFGPHAPGQTSSPSPTPVLNSINQFSQVSGSAPSTLSKATLAQRARRQREKGLSSPETLPPSNISFGPHAPGLNSTLPASPAPSTLLHSINQISEVSRSAPNTVSKAALAQRARRQREKGLSSLETILPSSVPFGPHAPGQTSSPSPSPLLNSTSHISQVSGSAPSTLSKATLAQRARRQREKGLSSPEPIPLSNLSFGPHAPGLNSTLPASPSPLLNSINQFSQVSGSAPNTVSKAALAQRARRQREKGVSSLETILPSSVPFGPHTPDQTSSPSPSPSPSLSPLLNSISHISQVSGSAPSTLSKATLAQRARRQREKGLSSPETLPPSNLSFGPHAPGLNSPLPTSPSPSPSPPLNSINQISEVSGTAPTTVSNATVAQRARRHRENGDVASSSDVASFSNNRNESDSHNGGIEFNNNGDYDDNAEEDFRWIANFDYAMRAQGRHYLGKFRDDQNICRFCKAWHWKDERLTNSSGSRPLYGMCCKQGTVNIPAPLPLPPPLQELYDGDNIRSRSFRSHIREYNMAFAFTSLGCKVDERVIHGQGPQSFTIFGELRHNTGSLLPNSGQEAKYSQLYIYDPSVALNVRQGRNPNLREDVLRTIQEVMLRYNRWSKEFKHAHEVLSLEAARIGDDHNVRAHLHYTAATDKRRYNLPSADEVAVILPGDGTEPDSIRDIIIHLRGSNGLIQISECHPAYLPLHYVLLYPYGELGWSPELMRWNPATNMATNKRLTQQKFYAYHLFEHQGEYSPILRANKVFHEWACDGFAAYEQNKLRWVRENQGHVRAELYMGITDISAECLRPDQIGRRTILPSSHPGSPRNMFEIYKDSMAITRYNRHPDIFLTMTANPRWPEIMEGLLPGQCHTDRPDLIARVFELKRDALLSYIKDSRIFGVVVAYVYTIEFQKRGLPHMHLLLYMSEPDKIHSVAQVDNIVCAEFPDPEAEPELFETIITCMVHGPCKGRNERAPCIEDGVCTKHYPRAFTDMTTFGEDGYPTYRRRDTGRTYFVRKLPVNNKDVVPYNPALSKMFNCHINVEVCAGIRCVKYIHKYIFKGHDRTTFVLNVLDEVQQYLDARYVGAIEAIWRLISFPMHHEFPPVQRLDIHLEGFHKVRFSPMEPIQHIRARAALQKSTLTAYFDCCASESYARQFTYLEFPQHYRWDGPNQRWIRRRQGLAIGRMYFVSPRDGDKFYLRLLLTIVKGPKGFTNLKTVDDEICNSFKEACIRRGLIEDDGEWAQCLREAAAMQSGYQLRRLFSVILLECNPVRPHQLWNEFSEHICDDLAYKLRTLYHMPAPTDEEVKDYGLYLLNIMLLESSGKGLKDFPPMPLPVGQWGEVTGNRLIWEQQQFQFSEENTRMHGNSAHLNQEQRMAYDAVIASVAGGEGKLFFLNGSAGTGKTFVYNTIAATLRSTGDIVIMVASSGIASLLLVGGRTSHSVFKIPFDVLDDSICGFSKQSPQAELFRRTKLIIWDEVPMQHKFCVEAVDRTLRDTCNNNKFFGGITVVFGGDFRQCLPVIPKGVREQIVGATLRRSYLWDHVCVLTLVQNMRLENGDPNNIHFANRLIEIGTLPDNMVQLPSNIQSCKSMKELLDATYPGLSHASTATPEYLTDRTILSARNDDVNKINIAALNVFPGDAKTYLAADSMAEVDESDPTNLNQVPSEYLNTLEPSGLPPFDLKLKVGCPIMALRNIAPKDGVCNGTRLKVVDVSNHVINAVVLTGDKAGEKVFIPRISLTPSSSEVPVPFTRRQYPVKLAFAMTINKAQGQSVKYVGIDLQKEVFSHGQLYVALSRCTSARRISVLLPPNAENRTTNIVYPEVLL